MFNSKRILELETRLSEAAAIADKAAGLAVRLVDVTNEQQEKISRLERQLKQTSDELNQLYQKTGCTKYQAQNTGPQ